MENEPTKIHYMCESRSCKIAILLKDKEKVVAGSKNREKLKG